MGVIPKGMGAVAGCEWKEVWPFCKLVGQDLVVESPPDVVRDG